MLGRFCMLETKGLRVSLVREEVSGLPLLRADIPAPARERRLLRAARLLYRQGVRRVLAPEAFPFWPLLQGAGLVPVDVEDLCRAMAAPLALAALEGKKIPPTAATVALRGERVTRAMRLAALALCPQVRNVVISAPVGGEALQQELRREYGVPALEDRQGREPAVALHFSPHSGTGTVLRLYGPCPDLGECVLTPKCGPLPPDCEGLPLLTVLWETGRVEPGDIAVRRSVLPPASSKLWEKQGEIESGKGQSAS